MNSRQKSQFIACIDMDAYYAQAEARRLGFADSVPLGVKQWEGLIAVSYSARKFGISRFTNAEEAKSLCPNIRLPHVDTYKIDESGKITLSTIDDKFKSHNRMKEKVSLDYFRMESKKIFAVVKKEFNKVEVASIDEVFIDLTEETEKIYQRGWFERKFDGVVLGDIQQKGVGADEEDVKMAIASQLVQNVRQKINDLYKYTSSAGISYNKLLAKLASGINKPNQQTIILTKYMPDCIGECKINKLRFFGGKVSQAFEKKGIVAVSQALKLSKEDLREMFQDEGDLIYVYERLRGFDSDEVKTPDKLLKTLKTKTILSQKTLGRKPAQNMIGLSFCIELLILDLFVRMNHFYDETSALPQTLSMSFYDNVEMTSKSKSAELRIFGNENDMRNSLEKTMKELLASVNHVIFPCYIITFGLRNFKLEKGLYMYNLTDYCKKMEQEEKKREENEKKQDSEDSVLCDKCGQYISLEKIAMHMDYHLACDLDKSLNPNKKKYKLESKTKESPLTQKAEPGLIPVLQQKSTKSESKKEKKLIERKDDKNRKIEEFFKKRE